MKTKLVLYCLLLLGLMSCYNDNKTPIITQKTSLKPNFPSRFDNFNFLDSLNKNHLVVKWQDKEHLYDSVFNPNTISIDTMRSEVIRVDTFEKKGKRFISILVATRALTWECHPCGPLLEVYSFSLSANGIKGFIKRSPVGHFGAFGYPPDVYFRIVGSNEYAYQIEPDFMMGGLLTGSLSLFELTDSFECRNIFNIDDALKDNGGMFPKPSPRYYNYETKLEFTERKSLYHSMKATKKGTILVDDKIINIDSTFYYTYKDRRYVLTKTVVNEKDTDSK